MYFCDISYCFLLQKITLHLSTNKYGLYKLYLVLVYEFLRIISINRSYVIRLQSCISSIKLITDSLVSIHLLLFFLTMEL